MGTVTALDDVAAWGERYGVPNAAAAVVGPTGVLERQGDVNRQFGLASVTKPLAAYAVLLGVEEGAVGLDDPAGPPGSTLRHLLAHTAGYSFESDGPIIAKPGARRIYSNQGIEVATAHLERSTGIAFPQYLQEAVLDPLGMTGTELPGSSAAGGVSTVEDLTRFVAELLRPQLLAPETVRLMQTVQFPGLSGVLPGHGRFDPLDWGLGVERNFSRPKHWAGLRVSSSTFGHFGGSGTFLWADPEHRIGAVCLTDRDFEAWARESWPALCDEIVVHYAVT